ncbi:gas vesicle protein [Alkalihalobacterium chitinilyticum]|uniref:Gas vesicle protein n=1 Tax=Alkalihalobacterium chitinilyticum TaxID=2980103 RepID=A0ABT5VDX4_9BACI|nr:gas vesicle protein [Alkalihalobacterium chitinilyticum]MDE5413659.1 gas vesicle protein [Alkalihalobacterium chitinilyticum]
MNELRLNHNKDISLLDILDAVLDKGVTIRGEILISVANIDLVYVDLRLLVTAVESLNRKKSIRGVEETM